MLKSLLVPILLSLLCGAAVGQEWQNYAQDWLNGDYYGGPYYVNGNPYYSYPPMGFTDYVFSPYLMTNYTQMYPYFGDDIFTYGLSPYSAYNSPRYRSDLYLQSLAPQSQTNWTNTLNIAKSQSSLRVYRNGQWVVP